MATARVLLVEDEGLIRLVMAEALLDQGFEVVEAWNGDETARLLDGQDTFDVLFTDVMMPRRAGTAWELPCMPGAGIPRSMCWSCHATRRTLWHGWTR